MEINTHQLENFKHYVKNVFQINTSGERIMQNETKIYETIKTMFRKERMFFQNTSNRMYVMPVFQEMFIKSKREV